MRVLVSMPGKFGDILWSLPTARSLAEAYGAPVDFLIAGRFAALLPLLQQQPYLDQVGAAEDWEVLDTAPMTPADPPTHWTQGYDQHFSCAYRGWPLLALPYEVESLVHGQRARFGTSEPALPPINLARPWITVSRMPLPGAVSVGFTDEHFELKYGVLRLVKAHFDLALSFTPLYADGSRWQREGGLWVTSCDWREAASVLAASQVFLGCCSALHVLAVALGVPAVVMEPASARHHPIFYPVGTEGPQVTLVKGNDGLPTWDARHVAETVRAVLASMSEANARMPRQTDTPTTTTTGGDAATLYHSFHEARWRALRAWLETLAVDADEAGRIDETDVLLKMRDLEGQAPLPPLCRSPSHE